MRFINQEDNSNLITRLDNIVKDDKISPSALLMRLESALHAAKEQGGNCLINLNDQQ